MLKSKLFLKNLTAILLLVFIICNGFMLVEGVAAIAATSTVTTTVVGIGNAVNLTYPVEVTINAELTLSCDTATSTMLNNILGMSGGSAVSTRGCIVKTNNMAGWTMTAKATTTPAMVNVASTTISIPDASVTPATWSAPGATTAKFGFNVTGTFADSAFSGSKYRGFSGTDPIQVGVNSVPTGTSGEWIYMNYKAEVGGNASQPTGLYRSWTTITAYMN